MPLVDTHVVSDGGHVSDHNLIVDTLNAKGPRAGTVVVAASNSVAGGADYTCTGTNDHTTINTAIASLPAAGGRVLLRAGLYTLAGEILIQRSNVTLEGEGFGFWANYNSGNPGTGTIGVGVTMLKQTSATAHGVHVDNTTNVGTDFRQHGITLSRLYIYGGGSTGDGIHCNDANPNLTDQPVIRDVFVHNWAGIGINVNADAPHLIDFTVMGCASHGLHLQGSNYSKVDNYSISDNGGTGIVVGNAASGAIHNMIGAGELVRNNVGVDAQGPYSEIVGAHVYNSRAGAVKIGGTGSKVVGGILRSNAGGMAVNLSTDADLSVTGVTILDHVGGAGIGGGGTRSRITGNTVQIQSGANVAGISIANAADGAVTGNTVFCASSTANGVETTGTSTNFAVSGNNVTGTWASKISLVGANLGDSAWTAPTLLNSWVNFGGAFANAGYRKDANGFVHLRGLIKSGTTTGGTVLFNLPAGYRPSAGVVFPVASNGAYGQIKVSETTAGNVTIDVGSNVWLSFGDVSFLAEA